MPIPDSLRQTKLTEAEVSDGVQLSDEAGWNQTPEDWITYIRHGQVIGLRDEEEKLIASAGIMPYPPSFGFLALVLVTQAWRHRGLATHLAGECLAILRQADLTPVLNATPAGAAAYERLGFQRIFGSSRWEGNPSTALESRAISERIRPAGPNDLDDLVEWDATAFGAKRRFLLAEFLARRGTIALISRDEPGFIVARQGRHATLIGPLVAESASSGLILLDAILSAVRGQTYLDVPNELVEYAYWLEAHNFRRQRPFLRMAQGRTTPFGDPGRMFIGAGPEFG